MDQTDDLESLARRLEATADYRVLRRLQPRQIKEDPDDQPLRLGIVLDTETTGLDPRQHEIIELAMIPFTYTVDGRIVQMHEPFHSLRQPTEPIAPGITRLTGIDNAAVAGRTISPEEVAAVAEPASLIIAHRAAFDRPFVERFCQTFVHKAWACSESQIDWANEGFEGTKLFYLATRHGLFFDGHRALDDCRALVELLARPLPGSGQTGLARLLSIARLPTHRVWALNAAFALKDALRQRGYRWNDGSDGRPRAWYRDVADADVTEETEFLQNNPFFFGVIDPFVQRMDAYDRFSDRW